MATPHPWEPVEFEGAAGLRLVGDCAGPADGPPVILLHGGGQTRHSWRRALLDLGQAGWRALALDARGHGDSAWAPDGDYGVDALCADLRAVIAGLGRAPVLVGASMGGHTALVTEGEQPGLTRALVLVDIVPQLESGGVQRIVDFMTARPDGFATLQEAAEAVAAYAPGRPRPADPDGLRKNLRQGPDGRWRWHWDPAFMAQSPGERAARLEAIVARMQAAAVRIGVPTLLVRGAESDVVSSTGVEALRQAIPQLEAVDIERAGHMVAGDRNDRFDAAVLEFLARHFHDHSGARLPR